MIGISRPTQRSRGSGSLVRADAVLGRDPVVDDLEALLVEALRLGEVLREPFRDRDVHVGERAHGAVGEAEEAPFAELVEAVLRGEPQRHPRHRPGELPVDVRMDEVRVQDLRPLAPEVGDDLAERERVDVGTQPDLVERHASRLELAGELPGTRLVLVQHQEPDVPAALAEIGQELEEVRLRPGDAGDLLGVQDDVAHASPAAIQDTARPRVDRVALLDALAQTLAERLPLRGRQGRERADPVGELAGVVAAEALRGVEQRVEDRVGGEHRHTCCRGLVDDLVGRARAHVVHERVVAREQRRDLGPRHRAPEVHASFERELVREPLELRAVPLLLGGERRPVDVQPHAVVDRGNRPQHDVEALRGRVPAEREQPQAVVVTARRARELREVDPVPDRVHLVGLDREGAAVDGDDRGGHALGRLQEPARAPVREPEKERDSERTHERRREHRVDRAHVRDDGPAPQAAKLAGERDLEARAAPGLVRGAKRPDPAVRRQDVLDRPVREHDDLVHEPRERGDLRDGRGERGMVGIDLLRDEDELHQKKSKSPRVKCHASRLATRYASSWSVLPMKRSFLFVGAKPEARSARLVAASRGGRRTSASAPPRTSSSDRRSTARVELESPGATTRSARNPAETPCLNVCPTTATPVSSPFRYAPKHR